MRKGTHIEIIWIDVESQNTWTSEEEVDDFEFDLHATSGYFLYRNGEEFAMTGTKTIKSKETNKELVDIQHFPISCVKRIRRL